MLLFKASGTTQMDEIRKICVPRTIGNYRIVAVLGEGAAGTVYAVEDMRTGTQFSLKAFSPRKGNRTFIRLE